MTEAEKVQKVLSKENIGFEQIAGEESSPLNLPVIEKDIAGNKPIDQANDSSEGTETQDEFQADTVQEEPLDAPEQEINEDYEYELEQDELEGSGEYELPTSHAKQAADAFLGMTDNLLEVGGGFFVKVKKHADFYDFDEIIQVIDEHNEKNVKRLRLEKEDKVLLKPLLVAVLKKKAKKLTPEQQLAGALISILVKKAQLVMEVRAENEILVDRILLIIREERGLVAEPEEPEEEEEEVIEESIDEASEPVRTTTQGMSPGVVLEVAEESKEG